MGFPLSVTCRTATSMDEVLPNIVSEALPEAVESTPKHLSAVPERNHSNPQLSVEQRINGFLQTVQNGAFRAAVLATRNEAEALDLVQDAMMRWASSEYAQKPEEEWKPLFFRILQNRIRDWQRRSILSFKIFMQKPTKPSEDELDLCITEQFPSELAVPDQQLSNHQFSEALIAALRDLPARQREAFVLRSWQGLSTRETATAMGCGEGSVMTHLSRAHHALRKPLEAFRGIYVD